MTHPRRHHLLDLAQCSIAAVMALGCAVAAVLLFVVGRPEQALVAVAMAAGSVSFALEFWARSRRGKGADGSEPGGKSES